jgi:hypothetical protein
MWSKKDAKGRGEARCIPLPLHIIVAVTVGVDGIIVLGLAARDFTLTKTATDTLGSALLLAISLLCLWALAAICRRSSTWLATSLASQISVLFLAAYVCVIDARSPRVQIFGVTGIALVMGTIAAAWVIYLGRHVKPSFTRGMTAVVALFPLLGLIQFWMETDYIPRTSRPLVDIEAELLPVGNSGDTIHLIAKVTLHNHGKMQANIAGGLMRVTAYPNNLPEQAPTPTAMAAGMDLSGNLAGNDFRVKPTPATASRVIFADDFVAAGSFLLPGMTITYRKAIDIDRSMVLLARLSVSGIFITKRAIQDVHTCYEPHISQSKDPIGFSKAATTLWTQTNSHFLCVENQIEPAGVIQELVADRPVLRVYVMIDNPNQPEMEFPQLGAVYGTPQTIDNPMAHLEEQLKIDESNPSVYFRDVGAEYSPKDGDISAGDK